MIELIVQVMLYVAGIFAVIGAIGMLRFPDFYTRSHAATLVNVGGVLLGLLSILLLQVSHLSIYSWKILFIIVMLLLVNPTNSHVVAHAAYRMGVKPKLAGEKK